MRIGIYGFGSIGRLVAKEALKRGWEISGAVDINEAIIGKDIGDLLGLDSSYGVEVSNDPSVLFESDVVIHATGSYLDQVYDQILTIIGMGLDVVSTCETLAYPYYRYPVLARIIDAEALKNDVTVIATGINPGFLLDTLAITMAMPVNIVKKITATRVIDAGKRRASFRKKVGIGLDPDEFKRLLEKRILTGHVGYAESVLLIADALGIHLEKVVEGQEPVVAKKEITYEDRTLPKGTTIGISGYGIGYHRGEEAIRVEFHAYLGAEEYEEITINGTEYSIKWKSSGTPGDLATASIILNIASIIDEIMPGLRTMSDIIPFKPFYKR